MIEGSGSWSIPLTNGSGKGKSENGEDRMRQWSRVKIKKVMKNRSLPAVLLRVRIRIQAFLKIQIQEKHHAPGSWWPKTQHLQLKECYFFFNIENQNFEAMLLLLLWYVSIERLLYIKKTLRPVCVPVGGGVLSPAWANMRLQTSALVPFQTPCPTSWRISLLRDRGP